MPLKADTPTLADLEILVERCQTRLNTQMTAFLVEARLYPDAMPTAEQLKRRLRSLLEDD
jgi:hypothetical protein